MKDVMLELETIIYILKWNTINQTVATRGCGAAIACPSRAPEFTPVFSFL